MSYNRYEKFTSNGQYKIVPFIRLTEKSTDLFEEYVLNTSRLDLISNKYYDDPNYDWLIMMANPEYGSMEFSIPDKSMLRIPYPLKDSLEDYMRQIEIYNRLNK
jgi:hypothetical protein